MNLQTVPVLPPVSQSELRSLLELQKSDGQLPQVSLEHHHVLHGGMYARTFKLPAGIRFVGALLKKPTIVIIDGDVETNAGRITGRHVISGSAYRKQVMLAYADSWITAIHHTQAQTVEDAEKDMTDDYALLASNHNVNVMGD